MEIILYIATGILFGTIIGWLFAKAKTSSAIQTEKDTANKIERELKDELATVNANHNAAIQTISEKNVWSG